MKNEEGCCRHNGEQRHSGEQQKRDGGPVGVHGDETELRHHLSKLSNQIVIGRPVTVVISLLWAGFAVGPLHAATLSGLQSHAMACLQGDRLSSCQTALIQAEALARRASARSAYPCQTLLLGLQADVIMQQLGDGRGIKAVEAVGATARGCAGL